MDAKSIPTFSSILWEYYDTEELIQLCGIFSVPIPTESGALASKSDYLALSRALIVDVDTGNSWALLDTLLEQIDSRNSAAIGHTKFEERSAHESQRDAIMRLREEFTNQERGSEIAVPAKKPFAAKAEIREFLEQANTDVLIVDPYVGVTTLDCLRLITTPIRLLTATGGQAIEAGFGAGLTDFLNEGRKIEVRQAVGLHDRHFAFNGRCWLVGSSLKDAGKKAFNCTEIVDSKPSVLQDIEQRWQAAKVFP
jgi:hypothetical protein